MHRNAGLVTDSAILGVASVWSVLLAYKYCLCQGTLTSISDSLIAINTHLHVVAMSRVH